MIHIVSPFFCAKLSYTEATKIRHQETSLLVHNGRVQRGLGKSFCTPHYCVVIAREHSLKFTFAPQVPLGENYRTLTILTTGGEPLTAIYDDDNIMLVDQRRGTCYLPLTELYDML